MYIDYRTCYSWVLSAIEFPVTSTVDYVSPLPMSKGEANYSKSIFQRESIRDSLFSFTEYSLFLSFFFFFFFSFFQAALAAYGSSQARGLIRATAACLHHSSQQRRIPNPLSKSRDEPASSWILVRFISSAPQRELPNTHSWLVHYDGKFHTSWW